MELAAFDDESLIRLIANRQNEALSELYDRYNRLVFSLALHTVGDQALAEEITQDVFFRIWEKAKTYQPEQAKVSTWLTNIARNRSIDMIRRRGVRPEGHQIGWMDLTPNSVPKTEGRQPEENAQINLNARKVRIAVTSLPTEQKEALGLAFFWGYSHSQIAKELGEPLGTVKTRIRLAMQKLRQILQEEELDP